MNKNATTEQRTKKTGLLVRAAPPNFAGEGELHLLGGVSCRRGHGRAVLLGRVDGRGGHLRRRSGGRSSSCGINLRGFFRLGAAGGEDEHGGERGDTLHWEISWISEVLTN